MCLNVVITYVFNLNLNSHVFYTYNEVSLPSHLAELFGSLYSDV